MPSNTIGLRGSTPAATGTAGLNLTPDQSSDRVLELSQKILTKGTATAADLTVLLFYATGASQAGQVPVNVQQALRDVLVKVPHAAEAIRKIRNDFMVPSMNDQTAAELQKAFTELTGQSGSLDALGVKKLLALAASQNQLSSEEAGALDGIASSSQVSEEGKGTIRSAVMEALVSQLEVVANDPAKATPIFKDILKGASVDKRFFGAAEEAYFGSSFDDSAGKDFRQLASDAPDASRLEMELAQRLAGRGGKLDNATTAKLFDRIDANAKVSDQEADFAQRTNKDPDGRGQIAARVGRLGFVDDAEKKVLTDLAQSAPPAQLPSLERGLAVASALMSKSGATTLPAAGVAKLNEALNGVMARTSKLDDLALTVWKSARGIESDLAAKLDGLQLGLPTPARSPNPYPPTSQAELSSVRQVGDAIATPLKYQTDQYLQLSGLDGNTLAFVPMGPSGGAMSVTEHNGIGVVANGAAIATFDLANRKLGTLPPLPTTSQTYRLADQDGTLVAVSGEAPAGQPSIYRFDDATSAWAAVPDGQVPAGPLNVVASAKELGLVMLAQSGEGALVEKQGKWTKLPTLPKGFSAESATSEGGHLLATGTSTSSSGKVTRELFSLDPANLGAGWSKVGSNLPWLVLDRDHALSAPTPSSLAGPLALSAEGVMPKKVPYNAAELERMTRLATEAVDELTTGGSLDADGANTAVELLETLKEANALKPDLAKKADALFATAKTDDPALSIIGERWYGAGLSTMTEPDIATAGKTLQGQAAISHQELGRFVAQSRASKTQLEQLLALPSAKLSTSDADLLGAESSRALGRRVDLLAAGKVTDADATALLSAAKTLKTSYAGTAAVADSHVERALTLGKMTGTTPDLFRDYMSSVKPLSDGELRLAISWFAKNGGGITTAELRALTALTDSDGVRSETEQRAIESLDWRKLAPNAATNSARVMKGVTAAADIVGDEKPVTGSTKVDGTGPLVVWAKENNLSSDKQTVRVGLAEPIEAGATGLSSGPIRVTGSTVLNSVDGLAPFPNGGTVTADGFDQVQAVWAADNVLARLKGVGVDIPSFLVNAQNNGVMKLKANAIADQNAFYSPSANETTFGTSNDTWHLASDGDVVTHELGHFTLDHLNPNMLGSSEGGAIHEGYGDTMAALMFNDPELSEDFNQGHTPSWLRDVENDAKLSTVSTEVHDRGNVYSGFAWSTKKKLAELIGDDAEAASLMLGVSVAHPLFYGSSTVTPEAYLVAMMKGADAYLKDKVSAPVLAQLKAAMKDEGIKRELVPAGWSQPAAVSAPGLLTALNGPPRPGPTLTGSGLSGAELAKRLNTFTNRPEVSYQVIAEPKVGSIRKAILQAHVTAPGGKVYPVEDGFVSVSVANDAISEVGGRGQALPKFDFTEPTFSEDDARLKARDLALKGLAEGDPRTNGYVAKNVDEIFAPQNVRFEEVLSNGQRARKVITRAAEFSVRRDGTIEVSKVMHVD